MISSHRQADTVVVLGTYMADRIAAKRVDRDRLVMVPVWSRREEIYPMPRFGHPLRAELGLSEKFVAMYSGNLGLAHSFDEFLGAARRLARSLRHRFLFVEAALVLPRSVPPRKTKDWRTSGSSTTSRENNSTHHSRSPMFI